MYVDRTILKNFVLYFSYLFDEDTINNKEHSEACREVLHEDPIRIRGTTSFLDYIFRIGGVMKSAVRITVDADSALPLQRNT